MNIDDVKNDEPSSSATLLFVDDEANILSSLRRVFRPEGYRILTAESALQGLEILDKEEIDLVISDMRMPEMDGAEFLEKVANKWPDTVRILLTGYADLGSTVAAINKGSIYRYTSKPWEDTDLILTVKHALERKFLQQERNQLLSLTQQQNKQLMSMNSVLEEKVQERTKDLQQTMGQLEAAHESLKQQYIATVKTFTSVIENREGIEPGRSRRVADIARRIAIQLNVGKDEVQQIIFASLLHDIGKTGVADALVITPFDKLSPIDKQKYAKHPIIAEGILMSLEPLHDAAKLIKSQAENFDGSGYPYGLKGEDIPMGSRIIALASDYDLLQYGKLLPRRLTPEEARDYISAKKNKRYDPRLVDIFQSYFSPARIDTPEPKEKAYLTKTHALLPGMRLSRDVVLANRVMLLAKGHVLDEKLIGKLIELEKSMGEELSIFTDKNLGEKAPVIH